MLYLITYDVATTTPAGRRRLRHAAQACKDYGQRVQKSVFECLIGPAEWVLLRERLLGIIKPEEDSLRIYPLDENARGRIEHIGLDETLDLEGPLIV
jgi:CRISPR-associated protein Cas2